MNKIAKFDRVRWCLLPKITRQGLILLLSAVLLSDGVGATASVNSIKIAQQSQTTSEDPKRAAAYAKAEELMEEAKKLAEQRTKESRLQAIAKSQAALKIWQEIGERNREATTINFIGSVYEWLGDSQKALEYYNQALTISRDIDNRLSEAFTLSSIAGAYSSLGNQQKALSSYEQALSLFRAEKYLHGQASMLYFIAQVYLRLGETKKSLDSFNQALSIYSAEKDLDGQASIHVGISLVYRLLGEPQKSLAPLKEALEIQRARKDLVEQASILVAIGGIHFDLGEFQKSLDSYNQALALQRQAAANVSGAALGFTLIEQANILGGIASAYSPLALGEPEKALDYYNQALLLVRQAGDRITEARFLYFISSIYELLGENEKALDSLNKALELFRAIKDRASEASMLGSIGNIYQSSGNYQKALDLHNQALDITRQITNPSKEARSLSDIANIYSSLGDYKLSIDTLNKALEIYKKIGDTGGKVQTLGNLGEVSRLAEDYPKALDYLKDALKQSEQGGSVEKVSILVGMFRVYESFQKYPEALDVAQQLLSLSRQQKGGFGEMAALNMLSRVSQASGDYQKALSYSQESVARNRKQGIRLGEASSLGNVGKAYNSLKQPQQAISTYNQQLALWQTLGDRTNEAETLYNIAVTEREQGNFKAALTKIGATIEIIKNTRRQVTSPELRTSYFASVQKYYKFYIDLLMQLHKKDPSKGYDAKALEVSESSRARGLVELLTETNIDIRKGIDPKLLTEERQLQWRIDAKEKLLSQLFSQKEPSTQLITTTKQQIQDLLKQQQELKTKFRNTNPQYAGVKYSEPLTLPQIQKQLDKDTVLLQYSLDKDRSYLWLVTPNSVDTYELPGSEQIETAASNLYKELTRKPNQGATDAEKAQYLADTTKAAQELSQIILAPVADKLGKKRLVVVADGILHKIPFAVLSDLTPQRPSLQGKQEQKYQPMLVNHEIITLPSVTSLATHRQQLKGRKAAAKTLAVLADPVFSADDTRVTGKTPPASSSLDLELEISALKRSLNNINRTGLDRLPGTRTEADAVLKMVSELKMVSPQESLQAFDFDANYKFVTSKQLSQYRLVLFATHGIFDDTNPELSGIVTSLIDKNGKPQKGFLRLNDIFNLDLPAELIVLSACESGLGKEVKGEGLIGLTRGLMYAGAARVVVSLWKVNDKATSELMQQLYEQILKQGKTPAVALREAQLKLWKQKDWQNPRYWSAFTIQGEWN